MTTIPWTTFYITLPVLLLSLCIINVIYAATWTVQSYPDISDSRSCKTSSAGYLCDPDSILSENQRKQLHGQLSVLGGSYQGPACNKQKASIQIALADSYQDNQGGQDNTPQFANGLMSKWVGNTDCNKHILIIFLKEDRKWTIKAGDQIYISQAELNQIPQNNVNYFRNQRYFEGLRNIALAIDRAYSKSQQNPGSSNNNRGGSNNNNRNTNNNNNYNNNNRQGKGTGTGSNIKKDDVLKFLKKVPWYAWAIVFGVIVPCLCCCGILYICKRRKSGGAMMGGGGGGGGGGGFGGAALGGIAGSVLPRIMRGLRGGGGGNRGGGGQNYPMESGGGFGGGGGAAPPPYSDNGGGGGGGASASGGWGGGGDGGQSAPSEPRKGGAMASGGW